MPSHKKLPFKIDEYLKLFDDDSLSSQTFPPYFILGQITAVASGPELVLPSEWMEILSRQDDSTIEFASESQAQSFIGFTQEWWNYCVAQFDKDRPIELVEQLTFTKAKGPSKLLKNFLDGYLYGYDWLKDDWDLYIEDESEESTVIGMATLLALQMSHWPEILKFDDDDIPDLVSESCDTPKELVSFMANLLSAVGQIGLRTSRPELPTEHLDSKYIEPAEDLMEKVGRNDPCPCGSGKKFMKCCLH